MLGVELALFIIVGAIAVLAAVMMLVSENAVHSALFLILNFACVAFFYLMLNAAFLAMIQITVYAGAIMVLFLFVIMLLGAEKLTPETSPQFPWLTPAAVGITTIFLFVASVAIVQSDVGANEPEPHDPLLRVVHAVGDVELVDVYANGELLADGLNFRETSEYEEFATGEYTAVVMPHGADPATDTSLFEAPFFLDDDEVISLVIAPNMAGTDLQAIKVEGTLDAVENKDDTNLIVLNVFPCADQPCTFDVADISIPSENPIMLIEDVAYGKASSIKVMREGEYALGAFEAGEIKSALDASEDGDIDVEPVAEIAEHDFKSNTSQLWVISADTRNGSLRPIEIVLSTPNRDQFGSGQSLGRSLFTDYMLPVQAVAMLLLVAMVGVIVLTNNLDGTVGQRMPQRVRRMAAIEGTPTVQEYQEMLDGTRSEAEE